MAVKLDPLKRCSNKNFKTFFNSRATATTTPTTAATATATTAAATTTTATTAAAGNYSRVFEFRSLMLGWVFLYS